MERKGTDDFLLDIMEEDPAAAALLADRVDPEQGELSEELWMYLTAFNRLMHDRHYGAFGGYTSIHYSSLSAYARDFGITGEDFDTFLAMMAELDREYLEHLERIAPPKPPEGS